MKDKRIATLLKLFSVYVVALIIITVAYNELPILVHYSLWGQDSFYAGFITNIYNSVLDFLVFSIILFVFLGRHEKTDKIQLYRNNIDDCRFWYSDEAAFKNAGNIRRLQNLGISSLDLSKCTLQKIKLKKESFVDSRFMGACLNDTNFDGSIFSKSDLQGATANKASFNQVTLSGCNLKYFEFQESQMLSANLSKCDFTKSKLCKSTFHATKLKDCTLEGADLTDCVFERADLRGAKGLTTSQLLKCKSIMYAKVDSVLADEVNMINPKLLKK